MGIEIEDRGDVIYAHVNRTVLAVTWGPSVCDEWHVKARTTEEAATFSDRDTALAQLKLTAQAVAEGGEHPRLRTHPRAIHSAGVQHQSGLYLRHWRTAYRCAHPRTRRCPRPRRRGGATERTP